MSCSGRIFSISPRSVQHQGIASEQLSDEGVFQVHRGVFDHPMFAPEPYTEREAWIWLLKEAAWESRRVRRKGSMIDLARGQLAHSTRFMAEEWKWSPSKVVRFLNRLKTDTMIETHGLPDATRITICNYDKYQFGRNVDETQTETPIDTQPEHSRNNLEEIKHSKKKDSADAAPARGASLISESAQQLADELLVIAGHDLKFIPPGWCGAAMRVQTWLSEWPREIIVAAVKSAANRKRGPPASRLEYFEPAVAEEFARQTASLPKVEFREAQTIPVTHGTSQNRSGLIAAIDRQLAALEAEDGPDPALSKSNLLRISG